MWSMEPTAAAPMRMTTGAMLLPTLAPQGINSDHLNREPNEWLALMTDPMLAQSAVDRVCSTTHELVIEGESYRRRQKPTNNTGVSIDTNTEGDQNAR